MVRYKKGSFASFLAPASPKFLVLNLSEDGIEFMSRESLKGGARMRFYLEAPKLSGAIRASGSVAWVKPSRNQEAFRVGARLTGLSGRSRSLLKSLLDNAVIDSVEISTRVYLREIEKL